MKPDYGEIASFRKELHAHPELSGHEEVTSGKVVDFLKSTNPKEVIQGIGGHGVAVIYGNEKAGPTLMIRCELDALPIQEINTFEYRSPFDSISHKCGHDGHMSILCALGTRLSGEKLNGQVVLLFQPAEENGRGAVAVLKDKRFSELKIDHVLALHNQPGYAKGVIGCKPGTFTPAVISIIIRLQGRTAHAGEPHKGINPAEAISEIIKRSRAYQEPESSEDFALVTPIHASMGERAYGISAGDAEIGFTLRTWTNQQLNVLRNKMSDLVMEVATKYQISPEIAWEEHFASIHNDPGIVEKIRSAASNCGLGFEERYKPMPWGEDFGLFTDRTPGAMFILGAGEDTPALHNPDYDYPDDITPCGVDMFYALIQEIVG